MPDQNTDPNPAPQQEDPKQEPTPKPTLGNAHAYDQGTDIHVAPGDVSTLPPETMHTVQH